MISSLGQSLVPSPRNAMIVPLSKGPSASQSVSKQDVLQSNVLAALCQTPELPTPVQQCQLTVIRERQQLDLGTPDSVGSGSPPVVPNTSQFVCVHLQAKETLF